MCWLFFGSAFDVVGSVFADFSGTAGLTADAFEFVWELQADTTAPMARINPARTIRRLLMCMLTRQLSVGSFWHFECLELCID
jgi:hypothetical protein